jgi:hypothetical protein
MQVHAAIPVANARGRTDNLIDAVKAGGDQPFIRSKNGKAGGTPYLSASERSHSLTELSTSTRWGEEKFGRDLLSSCGFFEM